MFKITFGGKVYYRNTPYSVYEKFAYDLGYDVEDSQDIEGWCELACIGERYEIDKGEYVEVIEDD